MPRPPKPKPKQPNGSGSVYFDKKRQKYRVMVTLPDGSRRTAWAATQDDALAKRNEMLGKLASGTALPRGDTKLASQIEHWRDYVLPAKRRAPATVEQYRWALGIAEAKLGKARLATLSVEQVERCLSGLAAEGYSRNSIRLVRNALSQVLGEAERRGHVPRNVARLSQLPADAEPAAERRALSDDECRRLLSAARGDRLEALWVLALTTGARRGELLGLSWSSIDLDAGTMAVTEALRRNEHGGYSIGSTKTKGSVRTVRLGPSAIKALKAHQRAQRKEHVAAKRWQDSGLVFTTTVGTHLDPGRLRRAWDHLCEHAGIEGVVFHELRHTVGSHAVDSDVPLAEVADQLGHADVSMLASTYRHRTRPVVEGVASVMEAFVSSQKRSRRR
jgi:integrase